MKISWLFGMPESATETSVQLVKLETDKIQPQIINNKDAYKADVSLLALETTTQLIKGLLENGSYGLNAIKTLIEAIDTSTELKAKFDEIKGIGWTTETLKAIKEVVDEIDIDTEGLAQEATLLLVKTETDKISKILGLSQENFRIFNPIYDTNNNLLSSTIKIYATKNDCDNDINPIAEYSQIATYNTDKNMSTYRVTKV